MKEYIRYVKSPDGRVFSLSLNGINALEDNETQRFSLAQEEKSRHFPKKEVLEHSANIIASSANVSMHETSANVIAHA